jgi:hypothetical protein
MIPGNINTDLISGADDTGYAISRSLRFNSSDSAYLSRTPASAGNRKTWTWAGWVKRSGLGVYQNLFCNLDASNNNGFSLVLEGGNRLHAYDYGSGAQLYALTLAVFRDVGAWYHVVFTFNSTAAIASDRARLYVNGAQQSLDTPTYPTQNADSLCNTAQLHAIGRQGNFASNYLSGYLADIHFIDGQALDPTSFGEFSATTGVWMPKAYSGSYGTNGFHLDFADNSAATATTLGKDAAGSNNWTPNNLSVTAGAGNDSLVDVPTNGSEVDTGLGGQVRGNYATWNPLDFQIVVPTNGNLDTFRSAAGWQTGRATFGLSAGKWYWETTASSGLTLTNGPYNVCQPGISKQGTVGELGVASNGWGYYSLTGNKMTSGTNVSYGATWTTGDVIGVAFDADNGTLTFYKNGVSQGQAFSGLTSGPYFPSISQYSDNGSTCSTNFGQRPFAYTAPSGFKALCTANLPAPTIVNPSTVMDVKLWTGNSSTQTISGLGFSPDLVWMKVRNATAAHQLFDVIRGTNKALYSSLTDAEFTDTDALTAFNSDGWTMGAEGGINFNGNSYVGWTWDAGSSTVTNTQGSISSQVRANASAGFSVVTYTGSSSNFTVGHGLGVEPRLILIKNRSASANWFALTKATGSWLYGFLNATDALNSAAQSANSSTIDLVNAAYNWFNANGDNFVAYCFAPVAGYSAMGSWQNNGSNDGTFVYLGFRPKFILLKNTDNVEGWYIMDSSRHTYNVPPADATKLQPNLSDAEGTGLANTATIDFLSNGFKIRTTNTASGEISFGTRNYIYAAFAESPFAANNRAR